MKLKYFAHSAFSLEIEGKHILIDPFLDDNPSSPVKSNEVEADYIILTHGHNDHVGDTVKIAERTDAMIIGVYELVNYFSKLGFRTHAMHIGGSHVFDFGKVKLTTAAHGSITPDFGYGGLAAGVIISANGKAIYHTGDTGLFGDMKLIGELNAIDILLLPIGDNFTMGIDDAVKAVEFINPKLCVPMHYNTFPIIETDPQVFLEKVSAAGFKAKLMGFGEEIVL